LSPCFGTGTRGLSKVTVPGPRNLWSETVATEPGGSPNPAGGASASPEAFGSSTQALIATGWFTVPVRLAETPVGGPVTFGPPCAKASTGGWLHAQFLERTDRIALVQRERYRLCLA